MLTWFYLLFSAIKPFDLGFPHTMVGQDPHYTGKPGGIVNSLGTIDFVPAAKAIGHA